MTKNEDLKPTTVYDELFSLIESQTGKVLLHSEMNDIINVVEKYSSRPTVTPDDRRKNKRCEGRNACGGCYPAVCLETDGYERAREVVHKSPTDTAMEDAVLPFSITVGAGTFCKGVKLSQVQGAIDRLYKRYLEETTKTTDGDAERYFNLMIEAFFTNPHLLSVWEKEIKTIRAALQSTRKPSVAMHCQLDKKCFVHCGADCDCMPIDVLLPPVDTINIKREVLQGVRGFVWDAEQTLYEINPSNYDHDEVCRLNNRSVEACLILRELLTSLDAVLEGKP